MNLVLCSSPCLRVSAFSGYAGGRRCAGRVCGLGQRVRVTRRRGSLVVRAVETEEKKDTKDKDKADRLVRGVPAGPLIIYLSLRVGLTV